MSEKPIHTGDLQGYRKDFQVTSRLQEQHTHTTYSRNNIIGQKCEGNCGLWALNEIIEKKNILKI